MAAAGQLSNQGGMARCEDGKDEEGFGNKGVFTGGGPGDSQVPTRADQPCYSSEAAAPEPSNADTTTDP